MKTTISQYQFIDNWPESRKDQFSSNALLCLYDYYSELENDLGEDFEYDPIAICCEWSEYESAMSAARDYGCDYSAPLYICETGGENVNHIDETESYCLEWLENRTQVIILNNGILIQQF